MPDRSTQIIANLQQVAYSVDGISLICGIDLAVPAHGITVIMGPNGAGKSTLLRLIAGLLTPTAGVIEWSVSGTSLTRQAFVFQRPVILRRTVSANIRHAIAPLQLAAHETVERVETALEICNLAAWRNAPARRLSGGEQQRLAMARALARHPEILLLDEPTASLDPTATGMIESITRQTADAGTKVVLVTHDAGQARRLAADIVFLDGGRVVEHSRAKTFFNQPQSLPARDYLAGRITTPGASYR